MSAEIMRREILEQPAVCDTLLSREEASLAPLVRRLQKDPPLGIVLAARGSSDHAATYARYFLEYMTGIPTLLAAPSLVSVYKRRPDFRRYLVIGVSQSGQGPDINAVMAEAARQGARTLGITNDPKSGLAKVSGHVLHLGAEKEQAVAATKTFTTELTGLALLAVMWMEDRGLMKQLRKIPEQMRQVLIDTDEAVERTAKKLKNLKACVVLGRGFQMGVAHEMGLKMKECAGVPALSYSTADFAHGPVSLAQGGFPVFLLSSPGKMEKEAFESTQDFVRRGASVYRVGLRDRYFSKLKKSKSLDLSMTAEADTHETLAPLLTILPGQWFAYHNALAKGMNPAMPKGLKKVTKTR
ncbi:MAG: SIS domain-containing protein [candidate division FCPU426 bacterium]